MILLEVQLLQSVHFLLFYLYFVHYFVHYLRINLADKIDLLLYCVTNVCPSWSGLEPRIYRVPSGGHPQLLTTTLSYSFVSVYCTHYDVFGGLRNWKRSKHVPGDTFTCWIGFSRVRVKEICCMNCRDMMISFWVYWGMILQTMEVFISSTNVKERANVNQENKPKYNSL